MEKSTGREGVCNLTELIPFPAVTFAPSRERPPQPVLWGRRSQGRPGQGPEVTDASVQAAASSSR